MNKTDRFPDSLSFCWVGGWTVNPKQRALTKEFAQESEAVSLGKIRAEQGRGLGHCRQVHIVLL